MTETQKLLLTGMKREFIKSDLSYQIISLDSLETISKGWELKKLQEIKKNNVLVESILLLVRIENEVYDEVQFKAPVCKLIDFYKHSES